MGIPCCGCSAGTCWNSGVWVKVPARTQIGHSYGGFHKWNGWFKMDNRIKTDDWGGTPQVRKPPYGYTIYILTNIDQPYVVFNLLLCFILLMIFMLFLRKQQVLSRLASVVSSCVAHHPWVTTLTDGHSLRHRASPWAQE